jgi:flavin reductase (DIM6/NTAB) family NADH-FMN oxidoreductase RutF
MHTTNQSNLKLTLMPTDLDRSEDTMMVPTRDNHHAFRNALGQFGTGVTVITAQDNHSPIGMTVNSFASVSLDPALVLWSIANTSERRDAFSNADFFAVHVLAEHQADLALDFAKNPTAFEQCEWHFGRNHLPILPDAIARFECSIQTTYDGGDHTIIIGKVEQFTHNKGKPLMFAGGHFGKFSL